MPLYEYFCDRCDQVTEHFFKIAERPDSFPCPCGGVNHFQISCPAIQCDDAVNVPWIREFAETRPEARFNRKTIQTRTEYKEHLKEKGLRPADGHNLSEV